jgi:PPM family protein phosphatase
MSKIVAHAPSRSRLYGAATDTGFLREQNEDRYWVDEKLGAYLVVDGMGGRAAGERAADLAVEAIRETIGSPGGAPGTAEERIRGAIAAANHRIYEEARLHPEFHGMACVLTLALVEEEHITIGHVGDSRLYLISGGMIRKITRDHSPVGEDEEAGEVTEQEAMQHPRRNEVFRDVGSRPRSADAEDFIDIRKCRFPAAGAILLCSDGLSDHLTSSRIREIVEGYSGDPVHVAHNLVDAANQAGGKDNITALFVAGPDFPGRSGITRPRLSVTRPRAPARLLTGRLAFMTYGLLLGMLLWAAFHIRG